MWLQATRRTAATRIWRSRRAASGRAEPHRRPDFVSLTHICGHTQLQFRSVSAEEEGAETAAGLVVRITPKDDVGARTADLFDWQAAMAAADGFSLFLTALDNEGQLIEGDDARIICEHHEDWAVLRGSQAELVSAKHRELATGAWNTVARLINDGGLGHLYERWLNLERKPTCRLVTSAAPTAGDPARMVEVTDLLRALAEGTRIDPKKDDLLAPTIAAFARSLMASKHRPMHWGAGSASRTAYTKPTQAELAEAEAFLRSLTIDHSRLARRFVPHAAPSMYARPVLERLKLPPGSEIAVWEAVHNLFRIRMRNAGPSATGSLPTVLAATGRGDVNLALITRLERRTVRLIDIQTAVSSAVANPLGYLPLEPHSLVTRLGVKMARGGCAETSISRAEDLRRAHNSYWRLRRTSVPGSAAELHTIQRALQRVADRATMACRGDSAGLGDSARWGTALWKVLDLETETLKVEGIPKGLDPDLALGGIGELAARCKVWFSEPFDVTAEIARIRLERGI